MARLSTYLIIGKGNKMSNFQTVMRDYCEWWQRPGLSCDRWGCAMDAAFKVADYMAVRWSEYPIGYTQGHSLAGDIIAEDEELHAFLDSLSRAQVRRIVATIGRYLKQLERVGYDY